MSRALPTRRRLAGIAAATALAAAVGGCSSGDEVETPEACLTTSDAYLTALEAAPGEVRVEGTPISDCLTPEQEGGDLARVGEQMVIAATELNERARMDPGGAAPLQLGYLIGAVTQGADPIHADLVLRLNSAASFTPDQGQPTQFQREFGRGFAAGQESG